VPFYYKNRYFSLKNIKTHCKVVKTKKKWTNIHFKSPKQKNIGRISTSSRQNKRKVGKYPLQVVKYSFQVVKYLIEVVKYLL